MHSRLGERVAVSESWLSLRGTDGDSCALRSLADSGREGGGEAVGLLHAHSTVWQLYDADRRMPRVTTGAVEGRFGVDRCTAGIWCWRVLAVVAEAGRWVAEAGRCM